MNIKLVSTFAGGFVNPADVLHVITVEGVVFPALLPRYLVGPFDAVLRLPGNCCNGAQRNCRSGGVHVKLAFDA